MVATENVPPVGKRSFAKFCRLRHPAEGLAGILAQLLEVLRTEVWATRTASSATTGETSECSELNRVTMWAYDSSDSRPSMECEPCS